MPTPIQTIVLPARVVGRGTAIDLVPGTLTGTVVIDCEAVTAFDDEFCAELLHLTLDAHPGTRLYFRDLGRPMAVPLADAARAGGHRDRVSTDLY
ncbi:hypothetical protein V6N00_12710 [Tersicoccus sp. MR15.9]|uniref:hypothetical protein n=1 Tax=Tersicoccus mangrovi TaxID=3121635 RepID=UPI002FE59C06